MKNCLLGFLLTVLYNKRYISQHPGLLQILQANYNFDGKI